MCKSMCDKTTLNLLEESRMAEEADVQPQLKEKLGLQEVEASRISGQSAHDGGKAVSPTLRSSLSPGRYPWYSFLLRDCVDPRTIVRPAGLSQRRIRMIPSGTEPATFRPVARCLNNLPYRVPQSSVMDGDIQG